MELEELKMDWDSATNQTGKQNMLTSKIITQMTQKKYQSKIDKVKYPEMAGAAGCIFGLGFIVFNFNKLDTAFLQSIGVLAILLLAALPALSYLSLARFSAARNLDKPYVEAVKQFTTQKLRFLKYQKMNALLSYLLLVAVIILLPKFFYGKDITFSKLFWTLAFSFGYIFLLFFSNRVKKFYSSSLKQAEELLKEI